MPRLFTLRLAVCLVLLVPATSALAGLDWQTRDVALQATPADEQVQAEFVFTNSGEEPVTITSVRSSCGCTTTTLDKKTYQPGEEGIITATYTLGSAASGGGSGEQVKQIIVRSDDPQSSITRLILRVDVPRLIEIQPRLVWWRADEPREAKTITLQLGETEGLKLAGVRVGVKRAAQSAEQQAEVVVEDPALHPAPRKPGLRTDAAEVATNERQPAVRVSEAAGVQVELKPVEGEAGQYELLVTPAAASAHERIELDVLLPSGEIHTLTVQARVFPSVQQSAAAE